MIEGVKPGSLPMKVRKAQPDPAAAPVGVRATDSAGSTAALAAVKASGLVQELSARPPVDSARVDALREAIAAGRYPVDAGRIADAMIAQDRGSAG
jgi:negative regulator of flagellin synthesis FlgM